MPRAGGPCPEVMVVERSHGPPPKNCNFPPADAISYRYMCNKIAGISQGESNLSTATSIHGDLLVRFGLPRSQGNFVDILIGLLLERKSKEKEVDRL